MIAPFMSFVLECVDYNMRNNAIQTEEVSVNGDNPMTKEKLISLAGQYIESSPNNRITDKTALHPSCAGMRIYEVPIFAFGPANDELYMKYKSADIIGSHFQSPTEWLPSANTVISFFLPYTDEIKKANAINFNWPAEEWLHGRYEGQLLLQDLTLHLVKALSEAGFESLAPSADKRFMVGGAEEGMKFASNWSERHVAYACGLGTFGLSKGLITEKGMCGRFGSILTELDLPKDSRKYEGIYEYCTMCGVCVAHCPAGAISLKDGKEHSLCSEFLDKVREKHSPRYGCGKCQVRVPCEGGIPKLPA